MSKQENIKKELEGRDLKFLGKYEQDHDFVCPCGTSSSVGYRFQDNKTGEILLIATYCAKQHLSHLLPKSKKGRRLKLSNEFLDSWKGKNEG